MSIMFETLKLLLCHACRHTFTWPVLANLWKIYIMFDRKCNLCTIFQFIQFGLCMRLKRYSGEPGALCFLCLGNAMFDCIPKIKHCSRLRNNCEWTLHHFSYDPDHFFLWRNPNSVVIIIQRNKDRQSHFPLSSVQSNYYRHRRAVANVSDFVFHVLKSALFPLLAKYLPLYTNLPEHFLLYSLEVVKGWERPWVGIHPHMCTHPWLFHSSSLLRSLLRTKCVRHFLRNDRKNGGKLSTTLKAWLATFVNSLKLKNTC